MSPMLLPTRFQITEAQLMASLKLTGIKLSKCSPLPDRPASKVRSFASLQGTGMVTEDGQRMNDQAQAVLQLVADPARLVSVMANHAGRPVWVETSFIHGDSEGPFVSMAGQNDNYDFALLSTATQATVLLDELLGLTVMASQSGEQPLALTLAGYAALLATTDVVQAARLQSKIDRERQDMPLLTADMLEEQLQKGLSKIDTRWLVTAGRMVCPVNVKETVGRMDEGLAELQAAGVVETVAGGYSLTQFGYAIVSSLGQIVITGGISLAVASGDQRVTVAHVSVFRTAVGIWIASWADADDSVRVLEVSASGALTFIRGLLVAEDFPEVEAPAPVRAKAASAPVRPVTEPRTVPSQTAPAPAPAVMKCPSCGLDNKPEVRFCKSCGASLSRQTPESLAPKKPTFCSQCGSPLKPGKSFCGNCGHRI